MTAAHVPVMVDEVLAALALVPRVTVVDGTLGGGGHFAAILAALEPDSRLIGLELDPDALASARERFGADPRVELRRANFAELATLAAELAPGGFDRVFLDLGVSRDQLVSERFSFRGEARLDGRLDPTAPTTVADLLADTSEAELERLLREYGDEPFARRIAAGIVAERRRSPIERADQLVGIVLRAYPPAARHRRAHIATRTFQALRIACNDLFGALDQVLTTAPEILREGGRLLILSYHSGEDRRVKQAFRELAARPGFSLWQRKPLQSTADEVRRNPSARSARLRVLVKGASDR